MSDTDNERMHRGALAAAAKQELHRRVTVRTEWMLADAINRARSKDGISGEDAKSVILAIGHMRILLDDINRDVKQGEEARERLMSPSRN